MLAKVSAVRDRPLGSELEDAATAGDTEITVSDVEAMDWDAAQLQIGGDIGPREVIAYTVPSAEDPEVDEIDLDDDPDLEEGSVSLAAPLANSYPEDTPVLLYPLTYERTAYTFAEGQDEVIAASVPDKLLDRILTGDRTDDTAETVDLVLEDDDWTVSDLVGEQGPGFAHGYAEHVASVDCSLATLVDPAVLVQVAVEIPTAEHRVLVWYSAEMSADDGTVMQLGLDDEDFDFSVASFDLATFSGTAGFTGPALVMPLLAQINLASETASVAGQITGGFETPYMPTVLMPYNLDPPTPGLHNFRLVASRLSGIGACSIDNAKLWVTVV